MERLIWASSSIASREARLHREPHRTDERLLDVDPAEHAVAERAHDRERLGADAATEHEDGDPRVARELERDPDAVGHHRQLVPGRRAP